MISGRRRSGAPQPIFWAPLNDNGDGTVNTGARIAFPGSAPTFTRATVAWTKLASGLWSQIASGSARSCYLSTATGGADTAAAGYGGYFAEGAGTQLVTPSASIRDMTDASWVKTSMTTAFTSTGIAGAANSATRCTASAANGTALQTLTAAASSRTYSCFIKRITGTGEIDITQNGGTSWTDITSQLNSSTFSRVTLNASVLNAAVGIRIVVNTDAIDVDFNQFEAGGFATSPMATAGAARNADFLNYPSTGNIPLGPGTLYAEYATASLTAGANEAIFAISNADSFTNPSAAGLRANTSTQLAVVDANTTGTIATDFSSIVKCATTFSGSRSLPFANGVAGTADAAFDYTGVSSTIINVGNLVQTTANQHAFGFIRNAKIYGAALANQWVSELS